ncbi:hypothetical protein [Mycolicibacterium pallens]|uniref:Uncharacterized protein n=1 Tax=Mycolicibacterium pallens TaxID=370524 RepID=A0ABX8VRM0_9MYCO|nr:hypothetical protein [Mycolicibacterium pallens]QYL18676.1 hypothetical protein K0O64_09375 [Mycolicibacterium pallens]
MLTPSLRWLLVATGPAALAARVEPPASLLVECGDAPDWAVSACATADPLANAAPMPSVIAPVLNQAYGSR